jgi:glycerol uptake facilitator-like aquaporin
LWVKGRINKNEVLPYVISQILGGMAAASVLYLIVRAMGQILVHLRQMDMANIRLVTIILWLL